MSAAPETPSLVRRLSFGIVRPSLIGAWRLKISGAERIPAEGPLIVASNHVHLADGPVLVVSVGASRYLRFLAKAELFRVPVLGPYLKSVGMVSVVRGQGDLSALRSAMELLKGGGCLGIFPEGTRTRPGAPGPTKPCVGFQARATGAPVLPARILNTDGFSRFRPIEVRFGECLRFPESVPEADARRECQAFSDSVMKAVFDL